MRRGILIIGLLLVTFGNVGDATDGPAPEYGAALIEPFKKNLKSALLDGLSEGPAAAIDACRIRAPEIARSLSTNGVKVGRTSHRLRNPANTAPDWVTLILAEWLATEDDRQPRAVELDGGREGYIEPIFLQPMCATCHGTSIAPELRKAIEHAYPADEATGFKVGELRGVFWVEYPGPAD